MKGISNLKEKNFERREQLLDSALNEFTAKSYEDASLNAILKNAGISKGTFYYHFSDKQALYLFLLKSSLKAKWDFIHRKATEDPEWHESADIFEKFRLQARLGAEFAKQFPQYHRLSRMLSKEQGSPIYQTVQDYLGGSTEEMLTQMVDAAIENGDFKSGYTRQFLVKVLPFLLSGFGEIFSTEEDFELDRMLSNLDSYLDLIRNGIGR